MAESETKKGLLEIKEVLPILKCSENTLRTWIKRGQVPNGLIMKIGRTLRIRASVLEKWVNGDLD